MCLNINELNQKSLKNDIFQSGSPSSVGANGSSGSATTKSSSGSNSNACGVSTSTATTKTCSQISINLANTVYPDSGASELSGRKSVGTIVVQVCQPGYWFGKFFFACLCILTQNFCVQ